jgi:ComF family protein
MFSQLIRFDSLLDILIPRACLLCRTLTREKQHLCLPCANELPTLSQTCKKCALILHHSESTQLLCGSCLTDPPPYDQVFALFPYQPPLPRLIGGLKFEEQLSHAQFFSHRMLQAIRRSWYANNRLPDCILPMPLHLLRLQERGYNQAEEVARPIACALKLPIDRSIIRSKATRPQSSLPAKERRRNIANAFTATRHYADEHIAVIDDVMTTGHTVTALAKILKQHGAQRVDIWCIARCDN